MDSTDLGTEQLTDEDRKYRGSRFSEVQSALFANSYQKVWRRLGEPPLPVYPVTLSTVLRGALGSGRPYAFRQATARAVDSAADLRWGVDRKGFRRLLHPNGVCLTGDWEITEETPYTGYFRNGSRALVVGRYSTCCTDTRRGRRRSLALVGKLFPTTDPNHSELLRTANFISQQDIGGDLTDFINDVDLLNAPNTTLSRRGRGAPILMVTGVVFNNVDRKPSIRQLYPIAELGKPQDARTFAPQYMRLRVAADRPRMRGEGLDFRDEVMAQIFDRGNPEPKRSLRFEIEVTDDGRTRGISGWERRTFKNWKRIGALTFDNAVISYNGDFVIHFNHPTWRQDRNDPSTATRVHEQKSRRLRWRGFGRFICEA